MGTPRARSECQLRRSSPVALTFGLRSQCIRPRRNERRHLVVPRPDVRNERRADQIDYVRATRDQRRVESLQNRRHGGLVAVGAGSKHEARQVSEENVRNHLAKGRKVLVDNDPERGDSLSQLGNSA